jgi:hypothetical protein
VIAMYWEKLGRIFDPIRLKDYELSAALMPIVQILDEESGLIRVFFSPRDQNGKSQVRFFETKLTNPTQILRVSHEPLLLPGKLGAFDDCGITLGSIVESPLGKFLFYTGWSRTATVPSCNSIGIAQMKEDGSFERMFDGPVMTRTPHEPYSCASPFVMYENDRFRMWYASIDRWDSQESATAKHFYNIKYAESIDGIHWNRKGFIAIDYENKDDYAFGRPFVLKEDGIYKMWYCFRGSFYKIGYAESPDGLNWRRMDNSGFGLEPSVEGWDEEMVAYPFIFDLKNKRHMLFNGNGYGKTGIGIAQNVK